MASSHNSMSDIPLPTIAHQADPSNQLKLGVKLTAFPADSRSLIVILYNERELQSLVDELVNDWSLEKGAFQLQFDSQRMSGPPIYITEENHSLIHTGDVLSLDFTPQKMTEVVTEAVQKNKMTEDIMSKLTRLCSDKSFAELFLEASGLDLLKSYLSASVSSMALNSQFSLALQSIIGLIEHEIVSWSSLDIQIVQTVIKVLQGNVKDPNIIRWCLVVVENIISSSSDGQSLVEQLKLGVSSFFHNIKLQEQDIQSKCISLVNIIYSLVTDEKRREIRAYIYSPPTRTLIKDKVFTLPIKEELAYQLYVLQTNMFNLLHDRLMTPINPKDDSAIKSIADLWQKAFEDNGLEGVSLPATLPLRKGESRDLSRLGFKNTKDPLCVSKS